jgi:hypothetical protein
LASNRNGNCGNYRWYNICSGYIWLWPMEPNESMGILFGGPEQPCVAPGNVVKRAITYFRNAAPGYTGVSVFLDRDNEGDGCPDGVLATDLDFDPGLRWNCSNFNTPVPAGVSHLIVRQSLTPCHVGCDCGWHPNCPPIPETFPTDGPFSQACDPIGIARTFYYGVNMSACVPWPGTPSGRHDNLLTWLIVDGVPTSVETTTWGTIKGLYR